MLTELIKFVFILQWNAEYDKQIRLVFEIFLLKIINFVLLHGNIYKFENKYIYTFMYLHASLYIKVKVCSYILHTL